MTLELTGSTAVLLVGRLQCQLNLPFLMATGATNTQTLVILCLSPYYNVFVTSHWLRVWQQPLTHKLSSQEVTVAYDGPDTLREG